MRGLRVVVFFPLFVLLAALVSGCGGSGGTQTTTTPSPAIASLNPSSKPAGSAAFTMTVNGSNFSANSAVMWNGASRTTTFVSDTQLTAAIAATDLTTAGTASVTVSDSGRTSSPMVFTVAVAPNPAPTVSALSPASVTVGSGAQTITVTGTNFLSNSTVLFNGTARTTTFVSGTSVTFGVTTNDLLNTGTATVAVQTPANASGGGGTSSTVNLTIVNPAPTITSMSPNATLATGQAFTLTVNGTGFVAGTVVAWNGSNRPTTYISPTQVTAAITAADIATSGAAVVSVTNPAPGGGTTTANFSITQNPVPTATTISPTQVTAGAAAFAMTVTGTNFIPSSVVLWNGSARATTYVSATSLTAAITAADVANAGNAGVSVQNPAPGGGTSGVVAFTINAPPNPVPTLAAISPNGVVAGGAGFTLTATGTNFVQSSTVLVNGTPRATTYGSPTSLSAQISAADIAVSGTLNIAVNSPSPGGGTTGSLPLTVQASPNPTPTMTGMNPSSINSGSAAFTIAITGTGFVQSSQVTWNGAALATNYVSATTLTAQVPAADVATAGTATVVVTNPQPGGGSSAASIFTINQAPNPVPNIAGLSPATASANSGAFTLTVNGSGFVSGSQVMWNGMSRVTTFVSANQVTAAINAADITTQGTATVTVMNPTPGGGTSNAVSFTITAQVNPQPTLVSLTPNTTAIRTSAITINLNGTGFVANSQVYVNASSCCYYGATVTYVNSTTLQYTMPASMLGSVATYQLSVYNPGPGGGQSGQVAFTVTAPVNPNYTLTTVNLQANDIVYDKVHDTFYASTPSSLGARGNSIVPVSTTGTIGTAVFAGSEPKLLAISDDCTYLYVQVTGSNQIKRFTLPELTLDETISFGVNASNQPITPVSMAVQPGHPHTLAVMEGLVTYSNGQVYIFDDTTPRSKSTTGYNYYSTSTGYDSMVWNANGSKLIVANYSSYYLSVLTIDSTGVASTTNYQPSGYISYGNGLHFDTGTNLVYDNLGHAVDPNTGTPSGVFQATGVMVPDSSLSTAYFLGCAAPYCSSYYYTNLQLMTFDINRYTPTSSVTLYANFTAPQRMVRWGTNGLAFNTVGSTYYVPSGYAPAIYIVTGKIVNPAGGVQTFDGGTGAPQIALPDGWKQAAPASALSQ